MSARAPLWVLSVPILSVLAICLYLRQRRSSQPPPDPPDGSQAQQTHQPAQTADQTDGTDQPTHTQAAADEVITQKTAADAAASTAATAPEAAERNKDPEESVKQDDISNKVCSEQSQGREKAVNAEVACKAETASTLSASVAAHGDGGAQSDLGVDEAVISAQIIPVTSSAKPVMADGAVGAGGDSILAELQAAMGAGGAAVRPPEQQDQPEPQSPAATWAEQAEAHENATDSAQQPEADATSENSSDSGKGGSSVSLEQASPSSTEAALPTIYDFLIPQKLCGRLIGKNGTFVNMLKSRTGANVFIRVHPVKTAVKICTVEGTQSEIDACLELIREKFPVQKFPAMTLDRLTRPQEPLSVPVSQQLHLPQSATCDVVVSAIVCPGQLFLQQHTHPTFRGLERLNMLMTACYGAAADATPQLPRPVPPSSVCAAPVLDGWYRAQVVAYYPDTDQVDVRFLDYGGYSRLAAGDVRQIRTDFMSLPFQAEECYLANVLPNNEEGWTAEESAVFESLICEGALEAMVVGHAEDGVPFVNLYSIQRTPAGMPAVALVNQQLVEAGGARWVENQA